MSAEEWELSEFVSRCEGCGRFVADENVWGDHERQGCPERGGEHGLDYCGCYLEAFCSEACADRWHAQEIR